MKASKYAKTSIIFASASEYDKIAYNFNYRAQGKTNLSKDTKWMYGTHARFALIWKLENGLYLSSDETIRPCFSKSRPIVKS